MRTHWFRDGDDAVSEGHNPGINDKEYILKSDHDARIAQLETHITNALRILDEPGHEDCPWCSHARYPLRAAFASETKAEHMEGCRCPECDPDFNDPRGGAADEPVGNIS